MSSTYRHQKVAFLDTNVVHYIGLYLKYAKDEDLFPWDSAEEDDESAVTRASRAVDSIEENNLADALKKGLATVAMVATEALSVQYAAVSQLELLTGRAKGQAILDAAGEGLPARMWSRFSEDEIARRVSIERLTDIKADVNNLTEMLGDARIAVVESRLGPTVEVLGLAMGINGLVYVDAMDSIIYANALLSQADYLYTADGYLKRTVNRIANPEQGSRYLQIKEQLRQLVGALILTAPSRVVLPTSPKLRVPKAASRNDDAKGRSGVSGDKRS